jgi:hypothetical protein
MGLLDDAIREHLELKRRHGADPSEVERQEQEALGPARRGAAPPAEDAEPDAGAVSVGMLDEDDDAAYDDSAEEPEPSVPAGEPEAPVAPPAPEPEPDREPGAEAAADVEAVDEPVPPDAAAGEDVLEETPEFLQETPEHDRLWFEQKPPRDFEF